MNDILKLLSSTHIRRTLTVKVLVVLAKLIDATLESCPFTDEMVSICLKAFREAVFQKGADPQIKDLRAIVPKLFLHIMRLYTWEDNMKSESIFLVCDDY